MDALPPGRQADEPLDHLGGIGHRRILSADFQLVVPAHHPDPQLLLDEADVLIEGAEDINGVLHPFNADCLFHHGQLLLRAFRFLGFLVGPGGSLLWVPGPHRLLLGVHLHHPADLLGALGHQLTWSRSPWRVTS